MFSKSKMMTAAVLLLTIAPSLLGGGCKEAALNVTGNYSKTSQQTRPAVAPYIPAAYYQCIEVLPVDLQNAYHTAYGNHVEAQVMYDGKTFLFRNLLVDQYMLSELDKGYIWADLTNCPVVNMDYAETLRPGDRIDIVGICLGLNLTAKSVLAFKDCYLLPTGVVQLPAPGGATFSPTY
jgi:hypothetical protein